MNRNNYTSPDIRTMVLKANLIFCLSGDTQTEGYTVGSNSYDEDDWE